MSKSTILQERSECKGASRIESRDTIYLCVCENAQSPKRSFFCTPHSSIQEADEITFEKYVRRNVITVLVPIKSYYPEIIKPYIVQERLRSLLKDKISVERK